MLPSYFFVIFCNIVDVCGCLIDFSYSLPEFSVTIWYVTPLHPLTPDRDAFFLCWPDIKVFFFSILFYCRPDSTLEEGKRRHGGKNSEDTKEDNVKDHTQEKQSSKKKGKGKKGKKGKGRGKKSNREASEKDITALKAFLDSLKGTRRLMVRTFSFACSFLPAFSLILV